MALRTSVLTAITTVRLSTFFDEPLSSLVQRLLVVEARFQSVGPVTDP